MWVGTATTKIQKNYIECCSKPRVVNTIHTIFISKNKIELGYGTNVQSIFDKIKTKYKNNPINTEDGLKIEFDKQWVHLRRSNTEPIIRIYSEGDSETVAENLANKIIADIKDILQLKN